MTIDIEKFERNIGAILRMALNIETQLEFFISNYFVKPQSAKTFFFNDKIVLKSTFERKKNIFREICKREKFDEKEICKIIKSIEFVQHARNSVAHWDSERLSENTIQLRKRKSYTTVKDILKIDEDLVKKVDEERLKAMEGITKFYLKYRKEGTIDEREEVDWQL